LVAISPARLREELRVMNRQLYAMYDAHTLAMLPTRVTARLTAELVEVAPAIVRAHPMMRRMAAAGQLVANARLTHRRPEYVLDGHADVVEQVVDRTPFASLLHFRSRAAGRSRPTVLLISPLSGHFSTMLAGTMTTLLRDHDVYVTDWHNARDIPEEHGPFGLDDYIDHVIRFIRHIGPDCHVMAVCQPCVPALAALALLADAEQPIEPRSLTLMSGPIDARVNPTKINLVAGRRSIDWYRKRCVAVVPDAYRGAGRLVYPGFLQVSAFMSLNLKRHLDSHLTMFRHLAAGRIEEAEPTRRFYAEYFAVLDIAAEFYLDTVHRIFQRHELALGQMTHRGRPVRPAAIKNTAVLTVEAERDDMCAPGQTAAAHDLTTGLSDAQRARHVQSGVGHYGVFTGRRWETEVYPVVRDFIAANQD
jgi:poly(3-hydroxybutyrate) depolymerase